MAVHDTLNRVWAAFRSAGITDDLRIIEYVAGALLEQQGLPLMDGLPRLSSVSEFDAQSVGNWLTTASEEAGGVANLFDRYALFRLPTMLAGGRYPTPRHITRLMTALAQTAEQRTADFACGSGGLLVYSQSQDVTGVELSPEWARIAQANAALHKLPAAAIRQGNALRTVAAEERFARIVMNPPFGEKTTSEYGTRSETALNALSLDWLAEGGRAALLAPSGLLFSSSQSEDKLRRQMVDEHRLEAVISLPEDAFQPYSSLRTHLLLVTKAQPAADAVTWFLRPAFDGYVSGRGRDLTTEPQTPNDLTVVEQAMAAIRQGVQAAGDLPFSWQFVQTSESLLGLLLTAADDAVLVSVRDLPPLPGKDENDQGEPAVVLVETQNGGQRRFWTCEYRVDVIPEEVSDMNRLRDRLGLNKDDDLPPPLFLNQSTVGGQTLATENALARCVLLKCLPQEKVQLLGVAVFQRTLSAFGYSLEPDRYLSEPQVAAEKRLPHDIVRDIRSREGELARRLTQLAGLLGPEPRRYTGAGTVLLEAQPFGRLDGAQQHIWTMIAAMREPAAALPEQATGRPFTFQNILAQDGSLNEDAVRLALEIFEAMGLIVPITIKHPSNGEPLAFYRLAQQSDAWQREQKEEVA